MTQDLTYSSIDGLTVQRTSANIYSASDKEVVIQDSGNTVQLPKPSDGSIVLIKRVGSSRVFIQTPSGNIQHRGDRAGWDSYDALVLVSDGSNWYARSGVRDVLSDIPDSATSQFKIDEGPNSDLNNEFSGQPDATINGADWVTNNNLVGGYGLDFVASNSDDVEIGSSYSFVGNGEKFAFATTVNMDDLAIDQIIWRQWPGGSSAGFAVGTGNTNSGKFAARYYDGTTDQATVSTTSATTNRLRLGVDFDAVNDSVTIFIDGTDVVDGSELIDLHDTGGDNLLGSQDNSYYLNAVMDNPVWYDDTLGASGHTDDYNVQPWS